MKKRIALSILTAIAASVLGIIGIRWCMAVTVFDKLLDFIR